MKRLKAFIADTDLKEILQKGSQAVVFRLSGIVLSYLFTTMVSRSYGIKTWGAIALSYTTIQLISRFSRLGLDRAALKLISEHRELKEHEAIGSTYTKALSILLPSTVVAGLLLALFFEITGNQFSEQLYTYRWPLGCSIPIFSLLYLNIWGLRALKRIKEYVLLENTSIFLFSISFLFLFQQIEWQGNISIIAFFAAITVTCVLSFLLWARYGSLSLSLKHSVSGKSLFKLAIPLLITSSLYLLMGQIDTLMIAAYIGEEEVGVYNIFTKVVRFTAIAVTGVESIFLPKISKFYINKNWKGLERMALKSNLLVTGATIAMALLLLLFKKSILSFFGADSHLLFAAMSTFYWLLAARFMHAILGNSPFILNMTDHQKVMTKIALIATLSNVLLNAILIPKMGIEGAAIASLVSLLVFNLSAVVLVKRVHNIKTSILQRLLTR